MYCQTLEYCAIVCVFQEKEGLTHGGKVMLKSHELIEGEQYYQVWAVKKGKKFTKSLEEAQKIAQGYKRYWIKKGIAKVYQDEPLIKGLDIETEIIVECQY